ncbi:MULTISPECIES: zinc-dependent alcohol dehydrogenase family protein [unclassified Corynebacterium]|uniref:zinc-dependent alcohol dehydrogenase family protein n=1 Tax=unclassified Corynebacterium TaxID=2624378 RepID=UPI0029CA5F70|nr:MULTISPECIES: zinc-dependent alcohol dehydrogenase family protein [unclassified Corynebacterium]WPF65126.1 zinc-dependent alcohol dehydrogenase family protein [Corynebacterium sp. 22KM0430]WPF67622.1 zinc-dependent alcohol dehydrogenase family protein [Corynebacterium sp. 21KM1197]
MKATFIHGTGDVRVAEVDKPTIVEPTDAIIKIAATCVCGSDLWPYRGADEITEPRRMGHEYVGVVEEVGSAVSTVKPGDFVVGSFCLSDNTCEICTDGYPSRCANGGFVGEAQSEYLRVPLADGTLVPTPATPDEDLIPSLLAASDVLGTGWFAADEAQAGPGKTVVVVGDGAVGLLAILSAKQMGAERIIAMSRHADRQALAREFGATDIVEERGEEGVAKVKELTGGLGAHSVIEAVGTQESMKQAIASCRPGGYVGYVGVSHGVSLPGEELFASEVHLMGGPAPVRKYLPELIRLIFDRAIEPGKVFTKEVALADIAEGYRAMDQREAIKVLVRP